MAKSGVVSLMLSFSAVMVNAQGELQHFQPVEKTGIQRAIVIDAFAIAGYDVGEGDEVAVYDGGLCAGAVRVARSDSGAFVPLTISSILRVVLPSGQTLPGATVGNAIRYRVWDCDADGECEVFAAGYASGDGTFGQNYTVVDSLTGDFSLPVQISSVSAEFVDGKVIIRWTAEREGAVSGYAVYRSASRDSDGTRLNDGLIAASGRGSGRTVYEYVDADVAAEQWFRYVVEVVGRDGGRFRVGAVGVEGMGESKNR
ncbi:hypothetical protein JXO52_05405 [bacterium]|nr:hypothetical protein [bacterium]